MTFFTGATIENIGGGVFTNTNHIHVMGEQNDALAKHVALEALHNSAERYDHPKCHPHTREAVLTRIMQWMDDPSNQAQIMWLFAPAGAGKSAIAQSIADLCFRNKLAASFFFSRNSATRDNSVKFITTLAYQLSRSIPQIQPAIVKAIKDDPLLLSYSLDDQAYGLITRPLNDVALATDKKEDLKSWPRLVIIDGLDECGKPKDQQYLLQVLLTTVKQLSYPLLFLVASRPEQVIRDAFNGGPMREVTTRLALDDVYKNDSDIRLFLQSKFNEIKQQHPAGQDLPNPWPSKAGLDHLVRKSSGQFIYASTVVKFVESSHHLPQDRLDIVFGLSPPEIAAPFAELDMLYHQIFASVVHIEMVLEIFIVLILLKDLLPRPSLLDWFLFSKAGSTRMFLSDLHSVLRLPLPEEKEGGITIVHASLSDFLLDPDRSKNLFLNSGTRFASIAKHISKSIRMKDNTEVSIEALYKALPGFCTQTKFPDPELLDDLFSCDLSQRIAWCKTLNKGDKMEMVEAVAAFFMWMKLKFHPDYDGDLFHRHIQAIDTWILDVINWLTPHSPSAITTSVSFLSVPRLDRKIARDGVLTDSGVLTTIAEMQPSEVDSRYPCTELYFHLNTFGSPAFGILLREFISEPAMYREQYRLDGEKCARLARNLWIYILPYQVRETFENPEFGPRYYAEPTFHNFQDSMRRSSYTNEMFGNEPALNLLPQILPKVSGASVNTLNKLLDVVQDYPLMKYADPADKLYDLHKAAAEAAEKLLGSEVFDPLGIRRVREREFVGLPTCAAEPTIEVQQEAPATIAQQTDIAQTPFLSVSSLIPLLPVILFIALQQNYVYK